MNAHGLTSSVYWVADCRLASEFPPTARALSEPDGLLAIGGDLSPARLLDAYARGIFPWYSEGQPILWWTPDPRAMLAPRDLHVSRSLRRLINKGDHRITLDRDFAAVVDGCAAARDGEAGTWITPDMRAAYCELHRLGYAHSVECRRAGRLVGGLYGLAIGAAFFGESMFSRESNASKIAFAALCRRLERWRYELIDCQVYTPHLARLGARQVPRGEFEALLARAVAAAPARDAWQDDRDDDLP